MDEVTRQLLIQMLLGGNTLPQVAGPGTYADGEQKDWTTAEQAKGVNLQQDRMQSLFDPRFAAFGAALGLPGGVDYSQMVEQEAPAPPPVVLTPTFDSYSQSQDPLAQQIAEAVNSGMPRAQVAQLIRANVPDADLAGDYTKDVDTIFTERASAQQAQATYDSTPQEKKLSPMEEMYRDAGLSSPLAQYDEATLNPQGEQVRARRDETFQSWQDSLGAANTAEKSRPGLERLLADAQARDAAAATQPAQQEQQGGFFERLNNLVPTALGGPGFNPSRVGLPDPSNTSQNVYNAFSDRNEQQGGSGGVDYMPTELLQRTLAQAPDVGKLRKTADQARRTAQSAHRDSVRNAGAAVGAKVATRGRTPLGDDMVNRQLLMRALGMG